MRRPTFALLSGMSIVVGLTGCAIRLSDVAVKPAYQINGMSLVGDAEGQYEIGKRALLERRFVFAVQAFQSAVFMEPSIERLNGLAVAYDHLGRYDLSHHYFTRALELDPHNVQTLNNFGVSLARRGLSDKAAQLFAAVLLDVPQDETVASNLVLAEAGNRGKEALQPLIDDTSAVYEPRLLPRIERVGMGTMKLITRETRDISLNAVFLNLSDEIQFIPARAVIDVAILDAESVQPPLTPQDGTLEPVAGLESLMTPSIDSVSTDRLRLEVANGSGRSQMAARMRDFLGLRGVKVTRLTNDIKFDHSTTTIFYRPDFEQSARKLAQELPIRVVLSPSPGLKGDIRLRLGRDLTPFDISLLRVENNHDT